MSKILVIKVQNSARQHSVEYKNEVNISDVNLVLQVLEDLELFDMPLKKIITKYLNKKEKAFPI